jgi:uncharacterized protein
MGKKKIVLDTNIIISAFGWSGKPRSIFEKVINKEYILFISTKQLEEIQRVLDYKKFSFGKKEKERFLNILLNLATIVETSGKLQIIKEDPDDNIIIETAIEEDADFLVTGDDDLLRYKKIGKVKIVTASDFLNG